MFKGMVFTRATSTVLLSNKTGDGKGNLYWMVQPLIRERVPCHELACSLWKSAFNIPEEGDPLNIEHLESAAGNCF